MDLTANDVLVVLPSASVYYPPVPLIIAAPAIHFGDGSKTYPTHGVPMPSINAFGMKKALGRLFIQQPPNGYIYVYDPAYHTIRIFQGNGGTISGATFAGAALDPHTHDIKLIGGITATEPVAVQGGDTLGKNAATDRTIVGADAATKGGVVEESAGTPAGNITGTVTIVSGPLSELGHVAVVAVVLPVMVFGE